MTDLIYTKKKEVEQKLMAIGGVTSVGIGRGDHNQIAIHIGIEKKSPQTEREIKQICKGLPIVIYVSGTIQHH